MSHHSTLGLLTNHLEITILREVIERETDFSIVLKLKHCSKQVHDLLLPLIKNLEAGPVLHLYDLLKDLPVKEHTEQTIHLAQVLQKFIWTSGGTFSHLLQEASAFQNAEKMAVLAASGAATNFNLGLSSSDMEDADSSTASAPALNPLAATAAVLMASQQHQQQQQQV